MNAKDIKGVINEGRWLRIKNGMTMDSGASVFVMPSSWLDMFELRESVGSRKGQTYVAAAKDGKPIRNEGEKVFKFYTKLSILSSYLNFFFVFLNIACFKPIMLQNRTDFNIFLFIRIK